MYNATFARRSEATYDARAARWRHGIYYDARNSTLDARNSSAANWRSITKESNASCVRIECRVSIYAGYNSRAVARHLWNTKI